MLKQKFKKFRANIPKYLTHFKFYFSSILDRFIFIFINKNQIWSRSKFLNTIVFITEDPRIDILKFHNSLKSTLKETNIIMLTTHSRLDDLFQKAGFTKVIYFNNHWDFRIKLNQLQDIDLAQCFTRRCYVSEIISKEFDVPLVISVKDTSVSSHGLNPPHWYLKKELPSEKYSLEKANGIIAESLEVCHATRLFKISAKPKRIYFPNYCEDQSVVRSFQKLSNEELHLVYVGSVRGSQDSKAEHGNIQMHWLIESLNEQKVHFHIYPNPNMNRSTYDEYFDMSNRMKYFHMHDSLSPDKMNQEISQYHYGLIPFFNEDTERSPNKRYYSSSLKIFNYIESGLPVLISQDMGHQRWILERYGLALKMSKSDFKNIKLRLGAINYKSSIENLIEKREALTLSNQMPRMKQFYNEVVHNFSKN